MNLWAGTENMLYNNNMKIEIRVSEIKTEKNVNITNTKSLGFIDCKVDVSEETGSKRYLTDKGIYVEFLVKGELINLGNGIEIEKKAFEDAVAKCFRTLH